MWRCFASAWGGSRSLSPSPKTPTLRISTRTCTPGRSIRRSSSSRTACARTINWASTPAPLYRTAASTKTLRSSPTTSSCRDTSTSGTIRPIATSTRRPPASFRPRTWSFTYERPSPPCKNASPTAAVTTSARSHPSICTA
ncbi:MAG: hypothetical protein MZV64_59265 [Ignavibacteriales bacterium]|nr:hypothetical protein [Ignavibacteriales bacterium]